MTVHRKNMLQIPVLHMLERGYCERMEWKVQVNWRLKGALPGLLQLRWLILLGYRHRPICEPGLDADDGEIERKKFIKGQRQRKGIAGLFEAEKERRLEKISAGNYVSKSPQRELIAVKIGFSLLIFAHGQPVENDC